MATKKNTEINGQEYFRITRTIGHKMVDGKKVPVKKQFYGSSKGDAEKKYKAFLESQAQGKEDFVPSMVSLGAMANDYLENVLAVTSKYAPSTKATYRSVYHKHLQNSWLDKMYISDIKPRHIQDFYNGLQVSKSVITAINAFLKSLYKWMQLNEYATDIMSAVEIPSKPKVERKNGIVVWEDGELDTILASLDGFRWSFLVLMLNYTGMRISEALGLKYSDIRDGVIHLTSQLYVNEVIPPKRNSIRDIPLHSKLEEALALHKEWHEAEMAANGYESDLIFTRPNGKPVFTATLGKDFARFYAKIGVPNKTFHTYRATFCTNLCRAGVPLEVASKLLGHKSIQITAQHYALVKSDSKRSAIEMLR